MTDIGETAYTGIMNTYLLGIVKPHRGKQTHMQPTLDSNKESMNNERKLTICHLEAFSLMCDSDSAAQLGQFVPSGEPGWVRTISQ